MEIKTKGLVIGLVLGLIAGGLAGFFLHNVIIGRSMGEEGFSSGNFQLTEEQISNVTSFFNSNPTSDQVQSYCSQSRMYCSYYCINVNPSNEICGQLNLTSQTGMPPQK